MAETPTERFVAQIAGSGSWPCHCALTFPGAGVSPAGLFRALYAALVPPTMPLPDKATDESGYEAWVNERGDGVAKSTEWVWMVGADQYWIDHLLIADELYIVTSSICYDHASPPPEPYTFELRARSSEMLERAAALLIERAAACGAALTERRS